MPFHPSSTSRGSLFFSITCDSSKLRFRFDPTTSHPNYLVAPNVACVHGISTWLENDRPIACKQTKWCDVVKEECIRSQGGGGNPLLSQRYANGLYRVLASGCRGGLGTYPTTTNSSHVRLTLEHTLQIIHGSEVLSWPRWGGSRLMMECLFVCGF